ncbi:lytic transglycosylase [Agrobacterium tumefaciens]|jgi:soluble lytic murein transglycosylase-like protein|uniref:Lytic murein transglycosylase n=1 Tax=Agrobacterium fabrum (strain C58 / ATCC 33970) TaxID=176299 RepID=A9CIA3_AGRFC|nr:lytic transglycosylase domain-containing protein [Agrobacterium fabrum]KEY56271.1 lytic transglycosylase [Agrobacterium tumefaciens]AAK87865.1 lytic murein transglycosylase [Agrobacterium fabrum str. C58]KJX87941.1 transglycosylase SLT domain protein [Agrobacterium tumefaciens]MCX2877411.1 lytic transglycosylase domain-containing protein [Agrobacterium fabrum]NMV72829.1 lytic transglycosylase domain-containing protein [Agrobacterium fabrum]
MRNSGKFRGRSALLLSSTVGLALALSACTSVEYAAKEGPNGPKIATVTSTSSAQTSTQPATAEAVAGATPAAPAVQTADAAASSQAAALPTAVAVKGGRVALPPASEIAAAAAIATQMQQPTEVAGAAATTAAPTTAAALVPTHTTPAAAAIETANAAAKPAMHNAAVDLPQVAAVKGSFPAAPPPPGSPSIGTELTAERKVIPLPKPDSTVLAYAAGPTNAALAAIRQNESMTAPLRTAPAGREKLSGLITKYATMYDVPEDLVHRVVQRESRYNPGAYSRGNFGLMQIRHATARSLGFDGPASGLFDAETNLKYAVKYLRGAWVVAGNDRDNAVRLYARGYYYDAKRKGMLHVLRN